LYLFLSCTRSANEAAPASLTTKISGALPLAILQPGEHPLWFKLTENGPVHIESIEDAVYSAALIPWPLSLHIRFFHERENELVMAVNRGGFLKLSPHGGNISELALYNFSGGDFWRRYTVGGFVYYEDKPAALLYLDNRFLDTAYPLPHSRTWTFNMDSNTPYPLEIPALELFPVADGWDADTLRLGPDGFWYYRISNRDSPQPVIRMMRTANLAYSGESISADVFFNSAPRIDEINHSFLPPLPEGFIYTGIGRAGDSLFASWEEQHEFNTGAAGFIVMKNP
jgi:hypothetical protein